MMQKRNLIFLSLIFCFVWASWGKTQEDAKVLTPELVLSLRQVSDITLDPTGNYIAYILRIPRTKYDKPGSDFRELWVVKIPDGPPRRYTSAPVHVSSPRWSPDGKFLAFLSTRKEYDEDREIYLIPRDGGEARQLSHSETSVLQFKWSPDGRWIAYTATDPLSDEQKTARKKGKDWEVVDKNYLHRRLWALEVATGSAHQVVSGDLSVWDFEWSPDSKKLVIQATKAPKTDYSYMFKKIYTVSVTGGEPKLLCKTEGKLGHMAWSPDGKYIAYLGAVDIHDPTNGTVFVVPATGGSPQNLSPHFKGMATWVDWLSANELVFTAIEGTHTTLRKTDLQSHQIETLIARGPIFRSMSFDRARKTFAFAGNTARHPDEVFFGKMSNRKIKRLTNSNEWLTKIPLAKQKTIRWKSKDGLEVEGVLWEPLNYESGKKYPLIVQVHGGPESSYLDGWQTSYSRWSQLLAARGYFFLMPNYRGSTGRGVAFAKMDQDDHGGKEFEDVLAGIDYLAEQGLIDPEKVGIGGGSYGGFLSAWAATRHSQRFKAAVVFAGVTNWISKSGTSDIPYENALVHWTSFWWEKPELVWERSPMAHIKNASTPTLIAHGSNDKRVPLSQGWELYRGLKYRNVPTEFVIYPREPHGLREYAHKLDYLQRVIAWFDRYVKGEGTH